MTEKFGMGGGALTELATEPGYVTSTSDIMSAFYIPALKRSVRYDRGVGFFTSGWMRMAAAGLAGLASNGGKARIVASPILDARDVLALNEGDQARSDEVVRSAMSRSLDALEKTLEHDTLAAIAWMVADGLLEFKVACPVNDLDGDFHDKFGVFHDREGNAVGFNGSPNDSAKAFTNYESLSVFYDWIDDREASRVRALTDRFECLWRNADPNVRIYDMPDAVRRRLITFRNYGDRSYRQLTPRPGPDRWRHQKEAMAAFLERGHGVLEMATGTGKTRTALSIEHELFERDRIGTVVIAAHGTDLLDQWFAQLSVRPRLVYRAYESHNDVQRYLNDPEGAVLLTSRTNLRRVVHRLRPAMLERALIVCDEVHGMGSPSMVRDLSGAISSFGLRLGLSATPDREYDEEGNRFIEEEIGPTIFTFTLEEAIRRGILCEFEYVPLEYEFSDEDRADVRSAIGRHHAKANGPNPEPVEKLYQDLARIAKTSQEKLPLFQQLVQERPAILGRCLIFVETMAYGQMVQDILMNAHIVYHTYYGGDDRDNLRRFADGELDCLLTCRRISEGIDIRSVGSVVLFTSARAMLETIQRIGRCLRSDPEQPDKRAIVVDFIRTDNIDEAEDELAVPKTTETREAVGWDSDNTDTEGGRGEPVRPKADQLRRQWFEELSVVQKEE